MKLTEAEWLIMNALWSCHPATAREIGKILPEDVDWAYTTIKTMLSRLVEKNAVSECKRGNTSVYEPVLSRKKAQLSALRIVANQAFEGAFGPLMHFLMQEQKLTAKQRKELKEILSETQKAGESGND